MPARCALLAIALFAALPGGAMAGQGEARSAAFDHAAAEFQRGRYSAAYGEFARLADHGDPRAAAIALVMHRESRALFRNEWDASLDQRAGWRVLAIEAVRREAVQP